MERFDIVSTIGAKYHVGNIENGEFSYSKALKTVGKDIKGRCQWVVAMSSLNASVGVR